MTKEPVEGRVRAAEMSALRAVEALNTTSIMFTLLDFEGAVRFENTAALAAHGYSRPDAAPVNAFTARFVDAEAGDLAWSQLISGESFEGDVLVQCREGQRWHAINADTTSDPATGERAVLVEERDITQRRAQQRRMQMRERMASIGELAGGLAHEINNPLAYVVMNLELLEELAEEGLSKADPIELKSLMDDLREGADRIRSTVYDLGELARVDSQEFGAIDIQDILKRAVAMTESRLKSVATVVTEFGDVPWVRGSSGRLVQVFVNVLTNAAQAIERVGGHEHQIIISTRSSGERVSIDVADTGPGADEENLARLFEPFFSTRPTGSGTGLGLSVARHIIADHGGEIHATHNEHGGLTIHVELVPVMKSPEVRQTVELNEAPRRVLVVDDEPGIRRAFVRLLEKHDVETASSGADALEHLAASEFDVVFCDIMMPVMDGIELYKRLEADGRALQEKIVFITGGVFTEKVAEFLARIPNATVQKPFTRDVLRGIIESA